jgi:hypothetical protein
LNAIHAACEAKVLDISAAIKLHVSMNDTRGPNEAIQQLRSELRQLNTEFSQELARVQRSLGVSAAEIATIERAYEAARLPKGTDFWHRQVLKARATEDLDKQAESGLDHLLRFVDPKWLSEQARRPYRLESSFLAEPLHLVNGVRVGMARNHAGSQRFARMLLLCHEAVARIEKSNSTTVAPEPIREPRANAYVN